MRSMRLISAAAGTALLAAALVGCSEAKDAVDDAKDKASEAGQSAMDDAKDKASDAGQSMLDDATGGADGDGKSGDGGSGDTGAAEDAAGGADGAVTVDYGKFADDPAAKTAGQFFTVRQAAAADGGDTSHLAEVATGKHLKVVTRYVKNHAGKTGPFSVTVVGVQGDSVDVCVGPRATNARTLTLEDGKVADNAAGDHDC